MILLLQIGENPIEEKKGEEDNDKEEFKER